MSNMATRDAVPVTRYVGWIWATGVLAILGWATAITLVMVDAFDNLPNPIPMLVAAFAGTATIICVQTVLAYAQRLATCETGRAVTIRESAAATTIQMRRIDIGRVYGGHAQVDDDIRAWPSVDRDELRQQLADSVPLDQATEMASVSFELGKRIQRRRQEGDI